MRQTAERALAEAIELPAVQPYFVGNAPAGHVQLGSDATHFFHRWAAAGGYNVCRALLFREKCIAGCFDGRLYSHVLAAAVWLRFQLPPSLHGRCQLIQGVPVLRGSSGFKEHVWVAKDELQEYIQQPELLQLLQKML